MFKISKGRIMPLRSKPCLPLSFAGILSKGNAPFLTLKTAFKCCQKKSAKPLPGLFKKKIACCQKRKLSLSALFKAQAALGLGLSFFLGSSALAAGDLYILNWSDYIAPQVLIAFEQEYDIKVHMQYMDSNEILEAKLLAGRSGFDVVMPSLHVLKRLSQMDLIHKLDFDKLTLKGNLDEAKMEKIRQAGAADYGIPYTELSTGLGVNEDKARAVLGEGAALDSWDLIFDEEKIKKLSQCGVTLLDSPSDMICTALIYLGLDPQTKNPDDYKKAEDLYRKILPYVSYIHSSRYMMDLAADEVCASVGWSGDIELASMRAQDAGLKGPAYIIPKEGALMGYDMLAIPNDAQNLENAYLFLNFMLRPDVAAATTNYLHYASANKKALPLVDPKIRENKGIYYDEETLQRMKIVIPPEGLERTLTRTWNRLRTRSEQP